MATRPRHSEQPSQCLRWPAGLWQASILSAVLALSSCDRAPAPDATPASTVLLRVGRLSVTESDLQQELLNRGLQQAAAAQRAEVLKDLGRRAQLAAAALEAELLQDSEVRAGLARLLSARLKETRLEPKLRELSAAITAEDLQRAYKANLSRYQSSARRQAAVLWLDPGPDPRRRERYQLKLTEALQFYQSQSQLQANPAEGFSVLSVDHSEHQASRYKGGVAGWFSKDGAPDAWSRAVSEIVFGLGKLGSISGVVERPEGLFVVRFMAEQPASQQSLEQVKPQLERQLRAEAQQRIEAEFYGALESRHPIERVAQPAAGIPTKGG